MMTPFATFCSYVAIASLITLIVTIFSFRVLYYQGKGNRFITVLMLLSALLFVVSLICIGVSFI